MTGSKRYGLLGAVFFAGVLAVGLPYWSLAYSQVQLPSALMGLGLVLVGCGSFALCLWRVAPLWMVTAVVGASVPAAVMARVVVEAVRDPTSHNLWPLEVMIAIVMGLFWAGVGAIAGAVLARFVWGRAPARGGPGTSR